MKFTPIVALVTDEALAAIDDEAIKRELQLSDADRKLFKRNGWTVHAFVAGAIMSSWVTEEQPAHKGTR